MSDPTRGTKWEQAIRTPIAGDLSARSYTRLTLPNDSAILMNASAVPQVIAPFQALTNWLLENDMSAPRILASSNDHLLLEDFGDQRVTHLSGTARQTAYDLAIDLLVHLRKLPPPTVPCPDIPALVDATRITEQFYPDAGDLSPFFPVLETVLRETSTTPTLSLRDFHADNLMWLPNREGIQKLGILDYQDSILTHPVYDLVSLLTDARADIEPGLKSRCVTRYLTQTGDSANHLETAFAAYSAQRNLRILGIFTRSATQGKPHHLNKLARVWRHFEQALAHPAFAPVRDQTLAALPFPDDKLLKRFA